jgi:hypothetical protein
VKTKRDKDQVSTFVVYWFDGRRNFSVIFSRFITVLVLRTSYGVTISRLDAFVCRFRLWSKNFRMNCRSFIRRVWSIQGLPWHLWMTKSSKLDGTLFYSFEMTVLITQTSSIFLCRALESKRTAKSMKLGQEMEILREMKHVERQKTQVEEHISHELKVHEKKVSLFILLFWQVFSICCSHTFVRMYCAKW